MRIERPAGAAWRVVGFDSIDFSDLTTSPRSGPAAWDGDALVLPFDPEPSEAEQSAIRLRLLTRDAAHEAQVTQMRAALNDLAGDDPLTNAVRLLLDVQLGPLGDL